MTKNVSYLALLVLVGLVSSANAQLQKGATSLGIFGTYSSEISDSDSDDTATIAGNYNYFMTDVWSLGVQGQFFTSGGTDNVFAQLVTQYYFPMEKANPYIGGAAGVNAFSSDTVDDSYGVYEGFAGVEFWLGERTSLDTRLTYRLIDNDAEREDLLFTLGIKFYFD